MKQIIFLAFLISFISQAQNSTDIEQRQGKLLFGIGTEYRITPVYSDVATTSIVNVDAQSSGLALNLSLDYFVTKNISLGFSNSFRYDVITNGDSQGQGNDRISSTDNGLIYDIHFYADYHFKVFNDSELFIRLGKSLLNRGTEYTQTVSLVDPEIGIVGSRTSISDFAYEPWNFGIGFKKDKISVIGGVYTSGNSEYLNGNIVVPYVSFKYTLGKL